MKGRKSVRIRSLFLGPVGGLKSNRSGVGHLARGSGNPGASESSVRLTNGHSRGGNIVGFYESGLRGCAVPPQSCGACESRQAEGEVTESTRGPKKRAACRSTEPAVSTP